MELKEIFDKLHANSFDDFKNAISQLRKILEDETTKDEMIKQIDDYSFQDILRPYYWFVQSSAFQDIYNKFDLMMQVFEKHQSFFSSQTDSFIKDDFLNLSTLGSDYLAKGLIHYNSWKTFYWASDIEIAATTAIDNLVEQMKKSNLDKTDINELLKVKEVLENIEGAKHDTYFCLRVIGSKYVYLIQKLIRGFNSPDKAFILHSLDNFVGDKIVIQFYKDFISSEDNESLKESAQKYLSRVQTSVTET